jgi:Holliday junction resolvase
VAYDKGSRRERELMELLEEYGFAVVRSAGSGQGGMKESGEEREQPDVLAGDGESFYAFESKAVGDDVLYIPKEEFDDLEFFAQNFGAKALLGVRFDYCDFAFFRKEELHETEKSYRVRKENIDKGRSISEI